MENFAATLPTKTETMILLAHNPTANKDTPGDQQKICIVRVAVFADTASEASALPAPVGQHPLTDKALMKIEYQEASFESMFIESVDAPRGLGFGRFGVQTMWSDRGSVAIAAMIDDFKETP